MKLNHPEAVALITYEVLEGARDGKTVAELMEYGATILTRDDVMEGIPEMIPDIQVEATFKDGTKLVTVHIRSGLSRLSAPGFTIRILAHSTQIIERIFLDCHHIISESWFQIKPSSLRKY